MINDRGTKKWGGFMMPEQVAMLEEMQKEYNAIEKPVLDEQQIEQNEFQIMMAHKDNLPIEVKYYKNRDFEFVKGYINILDYQGKYIHIVDKLGHDDFSKINFSDVIEVQLL